jgi:simple sugar transport system permease protein
VGPFDAALIGSMLVLSCPLLLAAIGEVISERAGVLNVGLEGFMLFGAFFGFLVAWKLDSLVLGIIGGMAAGALLASVMAALTVSARADQIVTGIGINLVAIGFTTFLFDEIFGARGSVTLDTPGVIEIPVLSDLGGIGEALFARDLFVYLAFVLVAVTWFVLYKTQWGLAIRSAGELPAAADTAGVSVIRVRWMATLTAGALAGLGGAYLSLVQLGIFRQEMTAGRGFLALAAVIFARWRPGRVLVACLLFGLADATQLRLQGQQDVPRELWVVFGIAAVGSLVWLVARHRAAVPRKRLAVIGGGLAIAVALFATDPSFRLPSQLWLAAPFLLALIALATSSSRMRMPQALAIPYRRGDA